ncbi:MAG: Gfo/Idh/MocA family oxidoreductase [Candidatus Hydrogenedentes bacterium]|nr:Gfo/Idh/MocA family oxidoreductase [Candidatus Hydrogenedentota bacterium]
MKSITRRQFHRNVAAGVAASSVALQIRSARAEVGPNDRIRIGAIGYGARGTGNLAEFLKDPRVECPIICDVDASHREKAVKHVSEQGGNTPEAVADFRRVIERNDLDAIVVSTPDHWHALPTVYACQTGKDVYVEKPLARTIDEGRAIVEAARDHKRVVQMGTQWRSQPHYIDAVAYIQSGKLGPIRSIRGWSYKSWPITPVADGPVPEGVDYDLWLGPAPERPFNANRFHRDFRWYWDYAGGLMTDLGVHVINLCQWATGLETPSRITSMGGLRVLDGVIETPDTQVALYEFPTYVLTWEHQLHGTVSPHTGQSGACFSGANGSLVVHQGGWEVIPDRAADGAIESEKHQAGPDGRPAHVRNFLDCMASREQPVSNPEVGHHVTALAHLGSIALRAGCEVRWDTAAERISSNDAADALVGEPYRKPWSLPYARRT